MNSLGNSSGDCRVICPFLTELVHDYDHDLFYCQYQEWTYAMVAFLFTIGVILVLGCMLQCIKFVRKTRRKRLLKSLSRQVSVTTTDNQSRLDLSYSSEYERLTSSPLHHRGGQTRDQMGNYGMRHHGPYGTFYSSLPDTHEEGFVRRADHGVDFSNPYSSGMDVRACSYTEGSDALQFDFGHFAERTSMWRKASQYSDPTGLHFSAPRLYPKLEGRTDDRASVVHGSENLATNGDLGTSLVNTSSDGQLSNRLNESGHHKQIMPVEDSQHFRPVDTHSSGSNPETGAFSAKSSKTEDEDAELGTSPYIYTLPTRKDFEDFLLKCVSKMPEDQKNGTFLIRESLSSFGNKVLMLYCKSFEIPRNLFYFKICGTTTGRLFIEGPSNDTFESLQLLIAFYREHRSFLPCLLADCLGTDFTFRPTLNPNVMDLSSQRDATAEPEE